jgi:Fe-S-cluster containining protein
MMNADEIKKRAADKRKTFSVLFKKLKKRKPADLDIRVKEFHNQVFSRIDCLECANCCKTISPMLNDRDIGRLSKVLGMRPADFAVQYLRIDEDGDYIFRETPCPFLLPDNYCSVYDDRPKACREYPHTDRTRFYQVLDLTMKNTEVCPAVLEIVDALDAHYK